MPFDSYISRGDTPEHSVEPGTHPLMTEDAQKKIIKSSVKKPAVPKTKKGSRRK
jgi:hypothetical protein